MFCMGTSGFDEKSVRNVKSRVKAPSRRLSSSSSTAGESSTNDASSPASTAVDEEESDEDEDDEKPAHTSAEDPPALVEDEDSETADSELPEDPMQTAPVSQRMRGNKKENKFKGNKTSKPKEKRMKAKEKKEAKKARAREALKSPRSTISNDEPDDEPYYIKLGECIVLDWYPEAIDSIFLGDRNDDADVRGQWLSADNGQGVPFVHDPATDAKRQRRDVPWRSRPTRSSG